MHECIHIQEEERVGIGPKAHQGRARATTVATVQGLFGDRHALALAATGETMIDGMLTILLDTGSNLNVG
eukprot:2666070-Pyramimonas_sp.AAC.1